MRTASELVRATKPFARESRWLSWWHFWSTLAALVGLLALACLEMPWWGRLPVSILAGYATIFLYGMCLYPLLLRPRQHADAALALLLHTALVTVLATFAPALLLWTLLLPLWVATALGSYLFYAQHNFPGVRLLEGSAGDYAATALAGSSYIPMNAALRWFTGNIGYHHVHHLNARIPFYRLPEAMAGLEELQSPGVTTLSPLGVYRCLRLKLWDPDLQRLVNFAGD